MTGSDLSSLMATLSSTAFASEKRQKERKKKRNRMKGDVDRRNNRRT